MEKTPKAIFIISAVLLLAPAGLGAEEVYSDEYSWTLNLVETWELLDYDTDNGIISFSDNQGHAVMQILVRNPDSGDNAGEALSTILRNLGAQGDQAAFGFSGHDAALADASWKAGSHSVQGYIVCIDDKAGSPASETYPFDYVLMVYSLADEYDMYFDFILSNLDAFQPLESEFHMPGIVSQFIRATGGSQVQPFTPGPSSAPPLSLSPDRYQPMEDLGLGSGNQSDIEAAQATIERESRILQQFAQAPDDTRSSAWRRFYQMIYRDSWYDMRPVAEKIDGRLEASRISRTEYPSEILSWLQGFDYKALGGFDDIEPSWVCLDNHSGDCDSLALIYMAILDHLGIDSLLMISDVHAHSLVGVDVSGPGARFPYENKQWLVAELTADVPIGMIAADQADPADWMGFDLDFQP